MRILYIYRYGILGGVTAQIRNRALALGGQVQISVVFLKDKGDVATFARDIPASLLSGAEELSRMLSENSYEVVTCIDTPEAYPWLAECGYSGPLLHEVHTTTYNLSYLNEIDRSLSLRAVLTPSRYMQQRLEGEFALGDAWPIRIVPNCLDTDLFQFRQPQVVADRPLVLWVGKIDDHKNFREFLRAAAAIRDARPECEFWMVGGRSAEPHRVEELFAQLGVFGLADSVRWIHTIAYEQMPRVYSAAAASGGVCLSVSKDESFGMSVAEAMACRCPVVCPRVGALPELLEGDLSCCLYAAGETEAAADMVVSLMGEHDRRQTLAEAGRDLVAERFSLQLVGSQYLELLREVAQSARPSGG